SAACGADAKCEGKIEGEACTDSSGVCDANGMCIGCTSDAQCAGKPEGPYCDVTAGSPKKNQCTMCKITNNDPATTDNPNSIDCPSSKNPVGDTGIIGRCKENSVGNTYGYCEWRSECTKSNECTSGCCSKDATGPNAAPGTCKAPGYVTQPWLCR
ncbi:MAG: hypothetical protein V1731_00415, partial [Candidatus Aenigmatarchaeota archaeon]